MTEKTSAVTPFVSIIMPIRNEEDYIQRSLGGVLNQDYPHDHMEVLIADGMSDDSTRNIVKQMAEATTISVVLVDNPGKIVPTGFNAALKQAHGEIIVRVDGHCEIAPDYVSRGVELLQSQDVAGVGGPIETISEGLLGNAIAFAMSSSFGVGGSAFRTIKDRELLVDTIAFPIYGRKAIETAGFLDEELIRNQDDEYNYRLRALGFKLLLSPKVKSRYYSRGSLRKLWTQYYQYGLYKVRVLQKHPRQMRPRQFVPAIFVGVVIGGGLLSLLLPALGLLWIGALILYLLADSLASVVTAARNGWTYLPLLPLVFATLHFSYGLGFWHGLVKFRNRWGDRGHQ